MFVELSDAADRSQLWSATYDRRLADLFELQDDIDGLVHISQLSETHVTKVKDVLKVGDDVEARVIKVDKVERRIGLSIKAVEYGEEELARETQAFEALKPSTDIVGLEQAFDLADWSPSAPASDPAKKKEEEEAQDK